MVRRTLLAGDEIEAAAMERARRECAGLMVWRSKRPAWSGLGGATAKPSGREHFRA
jgi:hypothetical protein